MSKKSIEQLADSEPEYKILVDIDKVMWSDMDIVTDLEHAQNEGNRADIMRSRAERRLNKARDEEVDDDALELLEDKYLEASGAYVAAVDTVADFKKRSASMIDRVAAITKNGKLVPALELPYSIVMEVQRQIAEAQKEAANPKNSKPAS